MKSWIEVSVERLGGNFRAVQQAAGPEFEVVAVIKADAYGHGAALCAPVLAGAGARWFGVNDLDEGKVVRAVLEAAGFGRDETHVLVMSGMEPGDAAGLVAAGLTPVVWTPEHIRALGAAAAEAGRRVAVHVEVDSGMARQGVAPGAPVRALGEAIRAAASLRCEGWFSHLSSAEEVRSPQTAEQERRFQESLAESFNAMLLPEYVHLANSSGVDEGSSLPWLRAATMGLGGGLRLMVRTGLALYGYVLPPGGVAAGDGSGRARKHELTSDRGSLAASLQPVAMWKTRVTGLRAIEPGETVGYGASFRSERLMLLALLPIGYADGFRRDASSGVGDGWVMIGGQRAPVVGRVSMNLTVVDVTGREDVAEDDEVVLLGPGVTAEDHARWCGTIPYEILCGMRGRQVLV